MSRFRSRGLLLTALLLGLRPAGLSGCPVYAQAPAASVGNAPPAVATAATAAQVATRRGVLHGDPESRRVLVPPTLEIELLDPNVDPLGNPAVVTRSVPGGLAVDIPPVVLVHKYYYTGDRSFQGPMLPGGPSIVVATDPDSGVRCYTEVQMLLGAPRVVYTRHAITYDYGLQSITLTFSPRCGPRVTYSEGMPLSRRLRDSSDRRKENVRALAERSGVAEANRKVRSVARNVAGTGVDRVHDAAKIVATPLVKLIEATPLGSAFTSTPEQLARRERDSAVRKAGNTARALNVDIPTLR